MGIRSTIIVLLTLTMAACQKATPLQTPVLIESRTPSPTTTQTATPTPTMKPTAGNESIAPTIAAKPTTSPLDIAERVLTEMTIDVEHKASPNSMCVWTRLVASAIGDVSQKYNNQYFTYATVSCGNQEEPWVLVTRWAEQGLGYPLTSLLGWSTDGKFAYYYDEIIPDGCQPPGGFQQDLRRVDLRSGVMESYPVIWTGGMALSPDSTMVVYYNKPTNEVGIYEFNRSQEQRWVFEIPAGMEYWYAGDFTWSPDGMNVVFIIQYGNPCVPSGVSVRRLDLQASKIVSVLEEENRTLSILKWTEPMKVTVTIGGVQQSLDPYTGQLSAP